MDLNYLSELIAAAAIYVGVPYLVWRLIKFLRRANRNSGTLPTETPRS